MAARDKMKSEPSTIGARSYAPLVLILAIVVVSSAAPFVRFGDSSISISRADIGSALLFVLAWLPFAALAGLLTRIEAVWRASSARWALLLAIALLPVVPVLHTMLFFLLTGSSGPTAGERGPIPSLVLTVLGALQYLTCVALVTLETSARAAEKARLAAATLELDRAQLQRELAELRVAALHAQLQPHFLFNTLNSVSALVTSNPPGARRMLLDLSSLLRSVLDNAVNPFVPLEREVEMVRAYLAIQQVRFGDRLAVDIDVEQGLQQHDVPPMLLQPLAENAVQHAIQGDEQASVAVRATSERDQLVLEVVNSGEPPTGGGVGSPGLGLRNTRDRLYQLYGDAFSLTLTPGVANNGAIARIELPLRRMST